MAHYKSMYDSEFLYAYDLNGTDVDVQIVAVKGGELTGEGGRKSKKPFLSLAGFDKKLAINKTNGKTIASIYGADADAWAGKWITLYATTTQFGGEVKDCIRIRPVAPRRGETKRGLFDLDAAIAAFESATTVGEIDAVRAQLKNAPVAHHAALKVAAESARARVAATTVTDTVP